MSKTFYRPTITLQKTIGDQLYGILQGPILEYIRNECEGEKKDESAREEQEGSAMLISEKVFPDLFRLCQQEKEALNFEEDIDFYITSHPYVNAWSLSSNAPGKHPHIIEPYSGLVNLMSEKELLFIIGHEIGHIINGDSQLRKLRQFIYGQQQPEDELELEMEKISNRFDYNLNEEESTFNFFYVAAGVLIGTVDHALNEDQKWNIIYHLAESCLFPIELFDHITEKQDLETLYHKTISLLEEQDESNKTQMFDYLLAIAFADGIFSENELHFIYHFGHEVGWDDKKIAKMIEASFRDYYNPNVLHYSEETQIQDL